MSLRHKLDGRSAKIYDLIEADDYAAAMKELSLEIVESSYFSSGVDWEGLIARMKGLTLMYEALMGKKDI